MNRCLDYVHNRPSYVQGEVGHGRNGFLSGPTSFDAAWAGDEHTSGAPGTNNQGDRFTVGSSGSVFANGVSGLASKDSLVF
jgi:hypothetical protein